MQHTYIRKKRSPGPEAEQEKTQERTNGYLKVSGEMIGIAESEEIQGGISDRCNPTKEMHWHRTS